MGHWVDLVAVTEPVYVDMPLAHIYRFDQQARVDERSFHWKNLLPAVEAELERVERVVAGGDL